MSGATVTPLLTPKKRPQIITLTPELATELLEKNKNNRPLSDAHVERIAHQIRAGKWKFNGDTIKVAESNDILDGQHRLWAVVNANKPVETVIVYGIEEDAFATIDTLRKPRSGADILALKGLRLYGTSTASALQWLLRWQRKCLLDFRAPKNRIENSDVEAAFESNPAMVQAVQRVVKLRNIANTPIMAFLYYTISCRNSEIAERMVATLEDPSKVPMGDPFFRLRTYFTATHKVKDPIMTIALAVKAANAAKKGARIERLFWKNQGDRPEPFPTLEV